VLHELRAGLAPGSDQRTSAGWDRRHRLAARDDDRTDGKVEVTYAGHPLYYFVSDKQPGDATGQGIDGFGGLWWVLTPSGAAMH